MPAGSPLSHVALETIGRLLVAGAYLLLAGLLVVLGSGRLIHVRGPAYLFAALLAAGAILPVAQAIGITGLGALAAGIVPTGATLVLALILWSQLQRLEPWSVPGLEGSEHVQLALAVEATQLGVWEYDLASGEVQCSESLRRILGLPPGAALTRQVMTVLVHPEDCRMREQALANAVARGAGGEYRLEYRIVRPDGAVRWVEGRGRLREVRSGGALVQRLTGTLLDVTERHETLEALERSSQESEQRFRRAFDHSAIGMALVSLDGQWLQVNRALCEIVGYPPEVLFTRTFQDITHPDDIEADLAMVQQLLDGSIQAYNLEKRYIRADGRETWALLTASLVRDTEGRPLYFVSQVLDMDEWKRADAERLRTEEELRRAKDAAEAASRATSAFLARMSHELRTPLNSIIGFSDLMLSGAGEVQAEFLEPVVRNGRHLLGLIEDILDLSKIEAGRSDLEIGPVDACRLAEQLSGDFEPQLLGRKVRLVLELPAWGRTEPVRADPVRLRQVLLNLVGNAIKFTPGGRVTLRVVADDRTRHVRWIEVEDTGIGIPADRLDAIFEAFEQAQTSTAREYGGTGLGLTISRRLCEQMGCTLSVTSTLGAGSTFRITFPVPDIQACAAA